MLLKENEDWMIYWIDKINNIIRDVARALHKRYCYWTFRILILLL